MEKTTCLTCNSIVVPKRRMNWLLLVLLNVWYLPFYFLSKKRCPNCKGKEFASTGMVPVSVPTTSAVRPSQTPGEQKSDAEQMIDIMFDVRRIGIQAMESAYIVATSKTVDTVVSRFDFLSELYLGLVTQSTTPSYSLHVQQAIDQFKAVRYNTIPESYQMQLVIDPRSFDLPEFYALSLEGVAKRTIESHLAAIQTLKKEDAKQRRMAKIAEDLRQCFAELDKKCRGAGSYTEVRDRLSAAIEAIETGNLPMIA